MNKFLVGNILREVKNGRLNCNNASNDTSGSKLENATYVKKIRKGKHTFPYASAQWQKKNLKDFAMSQGNNISRVKSVSTKEAVSEGHPYKNYDEDVLGFMIAKSNEITEDEYKELDKTEQKLWKKKGKKYTKNITKKRRSNLMLSTLQAIGHTRPVPEFSIRQTDMTGIIYTKEVYATDMSSSFILDIDEIGKFNASDNEIAFRDYSNLEVGIHEMKENEDGRIVIEDDVKLKRIKDTVKGLQLMTTRTTMTNNLEDLSAKFMILAEYKIGNSLFNNIFENNRLKIDFLKEAIEENEDYRLSKIYIGCRSEFFEQDEKWLRDILEFEFGGDDRVVLGSVNDVVEEYLKELSI